MKKKLGSATGFLCLSLYASMASAGVAEGLLSNFAWLNGKLAGAHCVQGMSAQTSSDLGGVCAMQLCGDPKKLVTPQEQGNQLYDAYTAGQKNIPADVKAQLDEYYDLIATDMSRTAAAFLAAGEAGPLKPSKDALPIYKLREVMASFSGLQMKDGPSKQIPVVMDEAQSLLKMRYMYMDAPDREQQVEWRLAAAKKILATKTGRRVVQSMALSPRQFIQAQFPDRSFAEAVKALAQEGLSMGNIVFSGKNGRTMRDIGMTERDLRLDLYEKAARGEELSNTELTEMQSNIISLTGFKQALESDDPAKSIFPAEDPPVDFSAKLQSYIVSAQNYARDSKDKDLMEGTRGFSQFICESNYLFQMATLPSKKQNADFQPIVAKAKNGVKEFLKGYLSAETNAKVTPKIDQVQFALPTDKETFVKDFHDGLSKRINDLKEKLKTPVSPQAAMMYYATTDNGISVETTYSDANLFCGNYQISYVSDHTVTSAGRIGVSWFSVRNPQVGQGIVAHELGHVAFAALENGAGISRQSAEGFQKTRACLSSNHGPQDPFGGALYNNEDFADLVSFKSVGGGTKMACGLIAQNNDSYVVEGLAPNLELGPDVHSTGAYRSLHGYMTENPGKQIPSACAQIAEGLGISMRPCGNR